MEKRSTTKRSTKRKVEQASASSESNRHKHADLCDALIRVKDEKVSSEAFQDAVKIMEVVLMLSSQ